MPTLKRAEEIARDAHITQTDIGGFPYINHPLTIMEKMPTEELKIIALLHDVVEDHPDKFSFDSLHEEGFSEAVITALKHLTKEDKEDYWDYIRRIADNDLAIEVKLADLAHNSDESRIPNPRPKDHARYAKYHKAKKCLELIREIKKEKSDLDLSVTSMNSIAETLDKLVNVFRDVE